MQESLKRRATRGGQDYTPPPPLPPWPRGAAIEATRAAAAPQSPDKMEDGHEITSLEVVRALLGNDLLRAVPTDIKRTMGTRGLSR